MARRQVLTMLEARDIPSPSPDESFDFGGDLSAEADLGPAAVGSPHRAPSGGKVPDLLLAVQISDADLLRVGTHGRRWFTHWLSEPVAGEVDR
jgi:hypothetical protein